jgi:hypothetical protein
MGNTVKVQFFARSDGGGNGNGGNGNGGGNAGDNSGGGISVGKVAPWAIILALLGGLIYAVTR